MASSEPVFLVGCDRSGTTLLRLMLNQAPELYIPPESGFLPDLAAKADAYGDFTQSRRRRAFLSDLKSYPATSKTRAFDSFGLSVEQADEAIAAAAPASYGEASAALFRASAARRGKSRWGDKTPRYVRHIGFLESTFEGSRFIHLIRDPRGVAASMQRAGWFRTARGAAAFWRERVAAGRRAGLPLGSSRYLELRYEDLLGGPEEQLRRVCQWLQITFSQEFFNFQSGVGDSVPAEHMDLFHRLSGPVDPSRATAWRQELSRRQIADVEETAGCLLADLGYVPVGVRRSWPVRSAYALWDRLEPVARTAIGPLRALRGRGLGSKDASHR